MSDHRQDFMKAAEEQAGDAEHLAILGRAMTNYRVSVEGRKRSQFHDWPAASEHAAAVKQYVLAHWAELLERFEERITARGAVVLWARDVAEAQEHLQRIVARHQAKRVVKSKSMMSEELGVNELLEEAGLEVLESDLGELIVQLSGEKPYHIVTPAMHKTKAQISQLFTEKLGIPPTDDATVLTMAARHHLRQAYVAANIGITGANFLIAEEGAVALTENEGNIRLTTACPPVHVVLAGIEKVLPRLEDLALFWPLLATSGTGQQLTGYNSVIRGPRQPEETDGPDDMYVILVDNGRTDLYADPQLRESLRCIRCGACLNACPVFETIGGHAYGTTYQGPIGSVITPHMRGMEHFAHLSQASSLCGACTSVCPVGINLHGLLLENRWQAHQQELNDGFWQVAMRGWSAAMQRRWRMEWGRRLWRCFGRWLPTPKGLREGMPTLAKRSFAQQWREQEKARKEQP